MIHVTAGPDGNPTPGPLTVPRSPYASSVGSIEPLDAQSAYTEIVTTLRDLGVILRPCVAAQYDAPPGGVGASDGIANPTLDIVADPRRLALSEEIHRTARAMTSAARQLNEHAQMLRTALTRWEGE